MTDAAQLVSKVLVLDADGANEDNILNVLSSSNDLSGILVDSGELKLFYSL